MSSLAHTHNQTPEQLAAESEASRQRGDYATGADLARQAAELAAAQNQTGLEAECLRLYANQLTRLGDFETAARACRRAADLNQAAGDEAGVSQSLRIMAFAYTELGLMEEALEGLAGALEIAHRRDDASLLFWAYNGIGNAQSNLGNYQQARNFFHRAKPLSSGLGAEAKFCIMNNLADNAVRLAAATLQNGGDDALLSTTLAEGLDSARNALELARAASHPYREAICLGNLGPLLAYAGDRAGAAQAITRSHAIAAEKSYTSLQLDAANALALIAAHFGDRADAIARYEAVLPGLIDNDEKPMILAAHQALADLYQLEGQPAAALDHFKRFHVLEAGVRTSVADTRARLMTSMTELSAALLAAERARIETQLHQLRAAELEDERHVLLTRARDLDRQVHEDDLTGLKNRRYANAMLGQLLAGLAKDATLPVAIVDADHFKVVNDTFGHAVGDEVLRRLATLLTQAIAERGFAARLGGEEFLLVFTTMSERDSAAACNALRLSVAGHDWSGIAADLKVTVSLGLAHATPGQGAADVLSHADAALYRSKSGGRNRLTVAG